MATVITAPELYIRRDGEYSLFLAGAIDMGAAVDWQAYVIDALKDQDRLAIVNPRRAQFTPDTLDDQILWELRALDLVDTVFMWFPRDAKAPISFFEAGLYWESGKLLVGAESGFYRRRNLELTADWYHVVLHDSLDDMLELVKAYPVVRA